MKKILSIILALGLVLGMSLSAVPAMADVSNVDVIVDPACELEEAEYTIVFDITAALHPGSNHIYIEFAAGTVFPADLDDLLITVDDGGGPVTVFDGEKWVAGTTLSFMVPFIIADAATVTVIIDSLTNPAAGAYELCVWTDRPADETPVCEDYLIGPAQSTYKFVMDFDKNPANPPYTLWPGGAIDNFYTGIQEDFIPPFGYCELTAFNLWLRYEDIAGCYGYDDVIIEVELCDAPEGGVVTIWLYGWHGVGPTLDWHQFTLEFDPLDDEAHVFEWGFAPDGFYLAPDHDESAPGVVHFSIPGDYCVCLTLIDLGDDETCDPEDDENLIEDEFCATVYQILDSDVLDPFDAKWNFFSSPLILKDGDIEAVLAPVIDEGQLKSVVHYDNENDKWSAFHTDSAFGPAYQSLTMIEDGKGYAVRMFADYEAEYDASAQVLWLFGNEEPEFPAPPLNYKVFEGWTMMGFTSTTPMPFEDYLYPSIVGAGAAWHFGFLAPGANMNPGDGYWVYFNADGFVVPAVSP